MLAFAIPAIEVLIAYVIAAIGFAFLIVFVYLAVRECVHEYRQARRAPTRRRGEIGRR